MNPDVRQPDLPSAQHPHPGATPAEPGGQQSKLDLSRVAPPRNLESFELEEITIDGICGVY